jgi:soluble lytic murein transglycosylase
LALSRDEVLALSRNEAAERLREGDIAFILAAETSKMEEISRLDPSAPFYAGILVQAAGGGNGRAEALFEAALNSPSAKIRKEAARKLTGLILEKRDPASEPVLPKRILALTKKHKNAGDPAMITLKASALYALGDFDDLSDLFGAGGLSFGSYWDRAFFLLAELRKDKASAAKIPADTLEALRDLLFDQLYQPDQPEGEQLIRWANEELRRENSGGGQRLPPADAAALAGHLAIQSRAYSEALALFESAVKEDRSLFFRYTGLLSDLGRVYQSIPSRREAGLKLFTEWEAAARKNPKSLMENPAEDQIGKFRYTILYFTVLIRRVNNKNADAAEFFTRALSFAPDKDQEDACIWYIISCTQNDKPENTAGLVKTYAKRWNDANTFYDVMDKLSCYLAKENKWNDLREIFLQIRDGNDGATIAKYAYITGRAVSEGYISGRGMTARDYFSVAYEESNASFYYRALGASHLGKTVIPEKTGNVKNNAEQFPHAEELEFYKDFFEYGTGEYTYSYLREDMNGFTIPEMRAIARLFAGTGRYLESIRITGSFMRREEYEMQRTDLEIYYPRPFTQLIETNALDNKVKIPVLFGLVRTESGFTPAIASSAGAVGLAQIMPATAKEVAASIKKQGGPDFAADGTIDLSNPEINVYMGAFYLKQLTDSMGSPMLALLAYNGGPGRIRRLRRQAASLPEDIFLETIEINETRDYGKRVTAAAAAYGYLYYGMSMNQVVADIFR